jgi:serine/threonine-protein kinase
MEEPRGGAARPGDVIAGKYRLEELIGQGGFGVVFRAVQLNLERQVAIKMMLPQALARGDGLARFLREADLARKLEHPNTVRLYDCGEAEGGVPYIALELLRGRPVDVAIRDDGPFEVGRAARIGVQALKSLMEAHALGIVHRDIKPSNLFLCEFSGERDYVKLLDFGIAKVEGSAATLGGTMLGTPAYMSPEQVSGERVTPASDLYALGLVLAELIAGRAVFDGDSGIGVAMAQLSDDPVPLPDIVRRSALGGVIARATAKPLAQRFTSAREMLDAIAAIDTAWLRSQDLGPLIPRRARSSNGTQPLVVDATALAATDAVPSPRASHPVAKAAPPSDAGVSPAAASLASPGFDTLVPSTAIASVPPTVADPRLSGSLPPEPSAAPTTSAPASRVVRRVLAGLVVLGVGVPAVIAVLFATHAIGMSPPAERRRPEPAPDRSPHALPKLRLATVTPKQLRDRLAQLGFKDLHEQTVDASTQGKMTQWVLASGEFIILWKFNDESTARVTETSLATRYPVYREGLSLVYVDAAENKRVLDQFAR